MTKEQFISILDKKLHLIKEDERKDIIDEYINHIDMKMQEGKTEEEAIQDFGDIDELVNEILDAYKINTNNVHHDNFDEKMNVFLDDIFEKFKKFVSSLTMLEIDDVVKLLFEIFVVFIALIILRIPFEIVSSFGASLLHSLLGFGIGSLLASIWKFMVIIVYIIMFVVLLVNICSKRIQRYRNHEQDNKSVVDDIKESFHFDKDKKDYKKASNDEHIYKEESQPKDDRDFMDEVGKGIGSIAWIIVKIFCAFLMIPFFGIAIALCIAAGLMISLSFQGVTLIGAYFILFGLIIGIFSFISLICRTVFKGGSNL